MALSETEVASKLDELAAKSPEKLAWKTSVVDLEKLLGIDSSSAARKKLATKLGFTGNEHDSAAMDEWLHKEILQKLAENDGKVPADLKGG